MQIDYPAELPIVARKDDIVRALRGHPVVVLAGETGSGKTTQLPKMCLEAGLAHSGLIGCTQPRRVAALTIARRLAEELRCEYGREVGAKIRFSDQTSRETVIKVMTDGILLAEMQGDPDLRRYGCILIDEAHERSLNIDFLLGHLKLLLPRRPDLKLIITSATIETEAFSRAFDSAPIIEVSGRTHPVEVLYRPFDHLAEELGEISYIEAAAYAVEEILGAHPPGDMLIFMPGEKDIRETRDLLEGRYGRTHEVVPLFGRLSGGDQERVFAPGPRPRLVIATNIAETSLTIPRIRYVIDAGLARVSRYSPRTRTKRLPIDPVSQSSANQRKGRCGRLAPGVCIRLYAEEDFLKRPLYNQPEIQRSNLAEVILRMKAFQLGEVETFPFLNPPQPNAIRAGYQLLIELGALDQRNALTPLGWDLARLPVDPAIGRMILQAHQEGALAEVLVIAAGLSIQDPRERPVDQQEAAEAAHARFAHPRSDFLTLLNIWNGYHDEFERQRTQTQMRRFCRSHFLSYLRMREWADIHTQLEEALGSVDFTSLGDRMTTIQVPSRPAGLQPVDLVRYEMIHRSILSGLLTHVAQRREKNLYTATGGREAMIFPGSNLFDRNQGSRKNPRTAETGGDKKTFQPAWLVAGELVETSRLYARSNAAIEPEWVFQLGAHLCKFTHHGPYWSREQGRVLVTEKILLGGLLLTSRLVPFGRVDPKAATEIFVRAALVEEPIDSPHRFLAHNRQLREKIETWQTRARRAALPDLDEALYRFYLRHLRDVSSVHDLNRWIKEQGPAQPGLLCAQETDLVGDQSNAAFDPGAFPESIEVAGHPVPLHYAYAPGEERDGVTARIPVTLLPHLRAGELHWAVPGWRQEQVRSLLKALPKTLRVPLMPLEPKVAEIMAELQPGGEPLLDALSQFLQRKFKLPVTPASWPADALPAYLIPRIEVAGPQQAILAVGRDPALLKLALKEGEKKVETESWDRAAARWERYALESWDFGDLPERIDIPTGSGVPLLAFPGLRAEHGAVSLLLFRDREEAIRSSRDGLSQLVELSLQKELAWIQRDLRGLNSVKDLYITIGSGEELLESAFVHLRNYLLNHDNVYPPTHAAFEQLLALAGQRLQGHLPKFIELVAQVLRGRQQLLLSTKQYPGLRQDIDSLFPARFLERVAWDTLRHYPRYLKAMLVRAERAAVNPAKDQEKARQILPYVQVQASLARRQDLAPAQAGAVRALRWLIEELKVSLFAQELGTSLPISPKRLDQFLEESKLPRP